MNQISLLDRAVLADPDNGASVSRLLAASRCMGRDLEDERVFYAGGWDVAAKALSDPGFVRERPGYPVDDNPVGRGSSPGLVELDQTWAVFRDAPAHDGLRRALLGALRDAPAPETRQQIEIRIDELVTDLRARQTFDVARDLSPVVPCIAMAALMGFTGETAGMFEAHTAAMLSSDGTYETFLTARTALVNLLADALDGYRTGAGQGILFQLSALMPTYSRRQIISSAIFLVTTGHGGVRDAISSALWLACSGRDNGAITAAIRTGARLDALFRETLRLYPPLRMVDRWVRQDFDFASVPMRRGDRIFILMGAALRDPERFDLPDSFNPLRAPAPSLSFGMGAHACLGQSLALWLWTTVMRALFTGGWSCVPDGPVVWSQKEDESRILSLQVRT